MPRFCMFTLRPSYPVDIEAIREKLNESAAGWKSVQPHYTGFAVYGNATLEELEVIRGVLEPLAARGELKTQMGDALGMML
jgi:hypothetical protein